MSNDLDADVLRSWEVAGRLEAESLRKSGPESLALLDFFSDSAPVGLAFFDKNIRFVQVNASLAELNGKSVESHLGRPIEEVLSSDIVRQIRPIIQRVLDEGVSVRHFEVTREVPSYPGQIRHHLESYYPVEGLNREVVGVGAVVIDITERKEAEERIRQNESRLQAISEAIPQVIFTVNAKGVPEYCNEQWFKYTGVVKDPGYIRFQHWQRSVHREDLVEGFPKWEEAQRRIEPIEIEFRVRRFDGVYRWHLARAVPVRDEEGRVLQWFGSLTDIHDQKQAEFTQRFLAEASAILTSNLDDSETLSKLAKLAVPKIADWAAIYVTDNDGKPEKVSIANSDPEKVRRAEEYEARFPSHLDTTQGVGYVVATGNSQLVAHLPPMEEFERAFPHQDQLAFVRELTPVSSMIVPLKANDRTLGALLLLSSDARRIFDERDLAFVEEIGRRAGLALDHARIYREAKAANRIKDDFLATLSHELRTPLNVILGWVEVLSDETPGSPLFTKGLDALRRNAQLQTELVSDLLDISRIITGKLKMTLEAVDFMEIVRSSVDAVRIAARAKNIRLSVQTRGDRFRLSGDSGRLQQILWNLLSNAVKFTPSGGAVELELVSDENSICLTVHDSGQGIDPAFLPYVFDRFRQEHSGFTRTFGGLGLGLSIVKHLVELHGGIVRAESLGVGRGATFSVILPRSTILPIENPPAPEVWEPRHKSVPLQENILGGVRVLVVDDSPDAREVIRLVLERAGASVFVAESAQVALSLLGSQKLDLLVSDIGMPEEDGLSLIRKLRVRERAEGLRIPAMALTAYAREEERQEALGSGFDRHMSKPVEPGLLVRSLLELVSSGRSSDCLLGLQQLSI